MAQRVPDIVGNVKVDQEERTSMSVGHIKKYWKAERKYRSAFLKKLVDKLSHLLIFLSILTTHIFVY